MDTIRFKYALKSIIENLPFELGWLLSYIPSTWIFGKKYRHHKNDIIFVSGLDSNEKKRYIFEKVERIVKYSYRNIEFYNYYYNSYNFHPDDLRDYNDIKKIPIVRKEDLQKFTLQKRSNDKIFGVKINTGGTTGEPLEFYIENAAFSREWAHMFHIWSNIGYSRTDLKLTFRGKNIGDVALRYNPVNNEYLVNTYMEMSKVALEIDKLLCKRKVNYLHGYPSAIYEFSKYLETHNKDLKRKLNDSLEGILFGSEFPPSVYRNVINKVFPVSDISWYGHSEMCILAYEKRFKWNYEPMLSYGYCEAEPNESGAHRLIGTSYDNISSPFIRYDTGDLVEPKFKNDILESFKISKGRVGEFIKDRNGKNVSLTSLIFGRHHTIFGKVKFIQIGQNKMGTATIYITPFDGMKLSRDEIKSKFDSSNVKIEFNYQIVDNPFRSKNGKVPLLVEIQ